MREQKIPTNKNPIFLKFWFLPCLHYFPNILVNLSQTSRYGSYPYFTMFSPNEGSKIVDVTWPLHNFFFQRYADFDVFPFKYISFTKLMQNQVQKSFQWVCTKRPKLGVFHNLKDTASLLLLYRSLFISCSHPLYMRW